jgi:hypothetical protein
MATTRHLARLDHAATCPGCHQCTSPDDAIVLVDPHRPAVVTIPDPLELDELVAMAEGAA